MSDLQLILSVAMIHLLAVISPGPDFFMVIKNSLAYSRRIGIYTAIGFGLGIAVHITYSIAGLALIISKSEVLFNTIKYLGVAYLIYIGIKSILSKPTFVKEDNSVSNQPNMSVAKAVLQGFLTNVLNPKATLFFLSLFTLMIPSETNVRTLVIISVVLVINTMLWFSLVASFLTQKKIRVIYNKYQTTFSKVFGVLLVLVALKILFL